jgi:6-phospho-beta-glucosidase
VKLTIIGGAGARVPLLVTGLLRIRDELPLECLALWDIDTDRQALIRRVCEAMIERSGVQMKIRVGGAVEEALEDADFVISSVRVGGTASRIQDEKIALSHGVLGQETVGPGGTAMALRTIPTVLEYARTVDKVAPRAWFLNFTNPVGIVQQALLSAGMTRVIGVCDTPRELFEAVANELGVRSCNAFFDYLGLNHLGWLRSVLIDGRDQLRDLLSDNNRLKRLYPVPLFDPDYLRRLGLLPTEYVYFYVRPNQAIEQLSRARQTRGQMVAEQEAELFNILASDDCEPAKLLFAYNTFLAKRNATYLQLETGGEVGGKRVEEARQELYEKAAGYERIAIDVIRAIAQNRPAVFPVDVANNGSVDELGTGDAVEVPCLIDGNGARPLAVGAMPEAVRELLLHTKVYERITVRAALEKSATLAAEALFSNPFVGSRQLAQQLTDEYRCAHRPYLDYLN